MTAVPVADSLTSPGCPTGPQVAEQINEFVGELPGVERVPAHLTFSPPWTPERISEDARFALGSDAMPDRRLLHRPDRSRSSDGRPWRRVLWRAGAAVVGLLSAPALAWGDAATPESGGSPNADAIDSLYKIVLYVAIVVFVGVEGTLVYSLVRFRTRRGRVAAQIHGNTRLEIGWTVAAALIVVVLTVVTFAKLGAIVNPASAGPVAAVPASNGGVTAAVGQPPPGQASLRIQVAGQQYIWRFRYPNGVLAYEEMVVPTDTTVLLDVVSEDVAHSWWIPKLGGKADAVPGYTNHTWFRIDRPGVFRGQCAELCGRNHADMLAYVRAVRPEHYQAWLATKQREIAQARSLAGKARPDQTSTPSRP